MKQRVAVIISIVALSISMAHAGDQDVAVKRMLKRLAGRWTWTGQQANIGAENSPYGQEGKFVGSGMGRLIMKGQFILDKYQEKSPEGNVLHGTSLISYDPVKKCFVSHDCMSDGSTSVGEFTIKKRARKDKITITTKSGEIILARVEGEYSRDWKRYEAIWEGSTDNGKTWKEWATIVNERTDEATSAEEELVKLEHELAAAFAKREVAVVDRINADDMTAGTSEGTFITKDDILNWIKSDKYNWTSMVCEDLDVKAYGNMAVVTGKIKIVNNKGDSQKDIITDVFLKRDGQWKMVATHSSKVADSVSDGTEQKDADHERNKPVMQRVFDDVFNGKKIDAIDEIYHKDFIMHNPDGSVSNGIEKHKEMVAGLFKNIPDYHENLHTMIVDGDLATCHWTSSGTNSKTEEKFSGSVMSIYRFKDGKIIEQWLHWGGEDQ